MMATIWIMAAPWETPAPASWARSGCRQGPGRLCGDAGFRPGSIRTSWSGGLQRMSCAVTRTAALTWVCATHLPGQQWPAACLPALDGTKTYGSDCFSRKRRTWKRSSAFRHSGSWFVPHGSIGTQSPGATLRPRQANGKGRKRRTSCAEASNASSSSCRRGSCRSAPGQRQPTSAQPVTAACLRHPGAGPPRRAPPPSSPDACSPARTGCARG